LKHPPRRTPRGQQEDGRLALPSIVIGNPGTLSFAAGINDGVEVLRSKLSRNLCIAGSRDLWNNRLKAKPLRPFGQRSDLLWRRFLVPGTFRTGPPIAKLEARETCSQQLLDTLAATMNPPLPAS
jgi:hypothetical protein